MNDICDGLRFLMKIWFSIFWGFWITGPLLFLALSTQTPD